jgi:glycosyltransferase involved in cell wall biosynthesis
MIGQKQTGIERYWKNLIESLVKQSKRIEIILYSNLKKASFEEKNFSFYIPPLKNGLYRLILGFYKAESEFKPDLFHVSNFSSLLKKAPVIVTVHDLGFKLYPKFFSLKSRLAFNIFFKRTLSSSNAIICVSDSVKKELVKFYPETNNKTYVIYEAADGVFRYIPKRATVSLYLKRKFDLKSPYFLVVGDIQERKNPFPIIDAFSILMEINPNLKLVFAGKNKMGKGIERKYSQLIESGNLKLLGYVSDEELVYLYNGAVSLIFNSIYEGFGLPIAEAMSCKTPVICSDIEVFREIASNAAIFAKNEHGLYKAMERVMLDSSFRRKYAKLGFQRSKYFSWQKTAKETLHVYTHVIYGAAKTQT